MIRQSVLSAALAWAVLGTVFAPVVPGAVSVAAAAEPVRPEVGRPLQAAQEALKARRYKDALARIHEADAVSNKTANETYLIERMRAAAAQGAGDTGTAIKAYEAIIASGKAPAAEQVKMVQAVAVAYYQAKDYASAAKWTNRYFKEGGNDPQMRTILAQAQYLNGDCKSIAGMTDGNGTPSEALLQMLASCYAKQKDNNGYAAALEKLVLYYPKKEYWTDVINRVQRKSAFSDRLSLDVYRLKMATGNMVTESDYMEATQLALQEGYTGEGRKIIDQGFERKVLGAGKEADRQKRLRDLAMSRDTEARKTIEQRLAEAEADKDGTGLVNIGYEYVTSGAPAKGLPLMEKGIAKGNLKRPEDAKLHLGVAYALAGQKNKAIQTLKTVKGTDGTADLARLWVLQLQQSA